MTKQLTCRLAVIFWFTLGIEAFAHDPGLSTAQLQISAVRELTAVITFSRAEVEALKTIRGEASLQALASNAFRVNQIPPDSTTVSVDDENNAVFQLEFSGLPGGKQELDSILIPELAPGHRQYLTVQDSKGTIVTERLLKAGDTKANFEMSFQVQQKNPQLSSLLRYGFPVAMIIAICSALALRICRKTRAQEMCPL